MDELRRLRQGMAIWDVWHHRVGTVVRVGKDSFDLRTLSGRTVRVREDALYWVGTNLATLVCNEARLNSYAA